MVMMFLLSRSILPHIKTFLQQKRKSACSHRRGLGMVEIEVLWIAVGFFRSQTGWALFSWWTSKHTSPFENTKKTKSTSLLSFTRLSDVTLLNTLYLVFTFILPDDPSFGGVWLVSISPCSFFFRTISLVHRTVSQLPHCLSPIGLCLHYSIHPLSLPLAHSLFLTVVLRREGLSEAHRGVHLILHSRKKMGTQIN